MTELAPARVRQAWSACRRCGSIVYLKRLARILGVCPDCGHHGPVEAPQRISQLADSGTIAPIGGLLPADDPLSFHDLRPYGERLREARDRTGMAEAVVCATARIGGTPVVLAVMDFRFLGGSLGSAVGELITCAAETACAASLPMIIVTSSGGARMQEGALSLMQMAKTSQAMAALDECGLLTITLVADPTYGGVAASFATLSDVIIAEPGARMGFAGPRVIEQTTRRPLPDGFQTAEFLLRRGLIDGVMARSLLRHTLENLLAVGNPATPQAWGSVPADPVLREAGLLRQCDPWETVKRARDLDRPTTLDYITHLIDDFVELHGDRSGGDCPALVGGLGLLQGAPVVVIGHQKGHHTAELLARNFGCARPEGYRKAARLMRLAAKLGIPVLTLVDTQGADPGIEAEEGGQAHAIAANLRLMSGLPVPIVAVVIGEGGSGGALGLGVGDEVLACENAFYSVISPEGCAAILWRDRAAAPLAAGALRFGAADLLRYKIIDGVIPEPPGGAQRDPAAAAAIVGAALMSALHRLRGRSPAELVRARRARFRAFGKGGP